MEWYEITGRTSKTLSAELWRLYGCYWYDTSTHSKWLYILCYETLSASCIASESYLLPCWEVIIRLWAGLMGLGSILKMWSEIDLSRIRKQQIINSIVWLTEDLDARLATTTTCWWGRRVRADLHQITIFNIFWILSATAM